MTRRAMRRSSATSPGDDTNTRSDLSGIEQKSDLVLGETGATRQDSSRRLQAAHSSTSTQTHGTARLTSSIPRDSFQSTYDEASPGPHAESDRRNMVLRIAPPPQSPATHTLIGVSTHGVSQSCFADIDGLIPFRRANDDEGNVVTNLVLIEHRRWRLYLRAACGASITSRSTRAWNLGSGRVLGYLAEASKFVTGLWALAFTDYSGAFARCRSSARLPSKNASSMTRSIPPIGSYIDRKTGRRPKDKGAIMRLWNVS